MKSLILASGSVARRAMLLAVGLDFAVESPAVDEAAIKHAQASLEDAALALALADAKAKSVSANHPESLVIGADQLLITENGDRLDQPGSLAGVRQTLTLLQGKRHILISAAVLMRGPNIVWSGHETASLVMRSLDRAAMDHYVETEGPNVRFCVGGYRIEGPGLALFDRIDGAYPAILGLPLVPLLGALRAAGLDPILANA